ncbi:3-hydroxyisobutyrate dehydrogenase [Bordetella holmesii]|uniref:3-hydroxyisobutyrate dehydrogenase n=2 Tax=Bordetella holmesii TaxID=35814 RepID=A0A158M2W7_9BORD|nr:3-hydroxyisobutyrate dehydrogenase [Bordetella holmesii]AHV91569.1 3-hydroxyisobutyrate dehydrogenase [Bordetella holmesii ATCC 51541]AIT26330.1 3-hydroxyisobutyrate dehydrogenase [Bordetella holmesii 44057]EWM44396.1 3-hydroxyisobutyrate dehydrogenase [Bordetella holmesii 41130]EWM46903.1 3-hydroxyisobutyrate dehydrogenase [Bordetella holmesii 35009]EWM51078.1 3-hydroxyisobutyrate dehydrogenase [Bordetella holmesii 70147]
MQRIGFIGLGAMGLPMAVNLLAKGYPVIGFDTQDRPAFVQAGGRVTGTVKDLVAEANIIITMLPNGPAVLEVAESQVLAHARRGQVLIDCSTIGVPSARKLHAMAADRGVAVLDAPVTGGVAGAQAGTLTIMVGGDETVFAGMRDVLLSMGSKLVYAGAAGNGQAVKICNNMAAGIIKIAISEAFVLARQLGVDEKIFFEVAAAGSAQSFALTRTCPVPGLVENSPSSRDYTNGFATNLMLKDMVLAQEAAMASGAATVLGGAATHLYQLCANAGLGERDNGIIYQYLSGKSA